MNSNDRLLGWICTLVAVTCILIFHSGTYREEMLVKNSEISLKIAETEQETKHIQVEYLETKIHYLDTRIKELNLIIEKTK